MHSSAAIVAYSCEPGTAAAVHGSPFLAHPSREDACKRPARLLCRVTLPLPSRNPTTPARWPALPSAPGIRKVGCGQGRGPLRDAAHRREHCHSTARAAAVASSLLLTEGEACTTPVNLSYAVNHTCLLWSSVLRTPTAQGRAGREERGHARIRVAHCLCSRRRTHPLLTRPPTHVQ
jgi:hypothetical protein